MISRLASVRGLLSAESGMTLVELLIALSIMLVVIAGITDSFATGAKSETNVAQRQQALSDARAALTRMRDDIHCSTGLNSVTPNKDISGNLTGGFTLELAVTNACAAVNTAGGGSTVAVRWCTVPGPQANVFLLYRSSATCGATGTPLASDIVAPQATGWPANALAGSLTVWNGNLWPTPPSCVAVGYLPTVKVQMAVNPNLAGAPNANYELDDQIAIRNAVRCAGGSVGGGGSANPTLTVSAPPGGTNGVAMLDSQVSATVAGSNNESAAITFKYWTGASAPTDCTAGTVLGTQPTTSGNGIYTSSGTGTLAPVTGNYWWYATMPSDGTNAAASSVCGPTMPKTVVLSTKWSPTLSITAPDTVSPGSPIGATSILATLAGSSGQTSGAISFKYWFQTAAPSSPCSGGTTLGTASPTHDGLFSPAAGIASAATGTYWWYASFAGDATDNAAATDCAPLVSTVVAPPAPTLTTLQMFDTDTDGRVDQVVATFSTALAPCAAPCTAGWTLANVPSGGTLTSVTISTTKATLNIAEGSGAADTSVGAFTVALANTSGIKDASGTHSSFAATKPDDKAGPVPILISSANKVGGTAGLAEAGDSITVTFSEALALLGSASSTVTLDTASGGGGKPVTLAVTGLTSAAFEIGEKNNYLTGIGATDAVFGPAASTLTEPTTTQVKVVLGTWNSAGALSAGVFVAGKTAPFTPAATITDPAGNAAAGSLAIAIGFF